jgi:hypothetical protein
LLPIHIGNGSGLRKGVQALPASLASLALLPDLEATREGVWSRWGLSLPGRRRSVAKVQILCAAFDLPGLPSSLVGEVGLAIAPPDRGALGTYLGRCAEVAGRLWGGGTGGLVLTLEVDDTAAGAGGGGFLGRVLGAVLPAAAPHLSRLWVTLDSGAYPPGCSAHLTAPGLAFPLLEELVLDSDSSERSMAAADVMALARLAAPRLSDVGVLSPASGPDNVAAGGAILGAAGGPCAELAVTALALTRPRPVNAAGRPGCLWIYVGCEADLGTQQDIEGALAGAGRGWVYVCWPDCAEAATSEEEDEEDSEGWGSYDGSSDECCPCRICRLQPCELGRR